MVEERDAKDEGRGRGWLEAFLAAALAWALLALLASSSTLWDRDEARFARAAEEMLASGNALYPTLGGEVRADKPILIYWLMAASIRWLGPTELACRFWGTVGLTLSALVTFHLGARTWNPRAGLLAMGFLLASPLAVVSGTAATADGVLLFFTTAAVATFAAAVRSGPRLRHGILFGLFTAGAQLVKGPVGLAVPALAAAGTAWFGRRHHLVTRRLAILVLAASVLATALFLAWAVPADRATGGELLRRGLLHHVLGRMVRPLEGHGGGSWITYLALLPFYALVLPVAVFPGTLFLPAAAAALWRRRGFADTTRALLLGWCVPTFLLMSLVATKLPHYILPILPAVALAQARTAERALGGGLEAGEERWFRAGAWSVLVLGAAAAIGAAAAPWVPGLRPLAAPGAAVALVLLGASAWGAREALRGRPGRALLWHAGGQVVLILTAALLVLPRLEAFRPVPPLARRVREVAGPGVAVAACEFREPSLLFYLHRRRLEILPPAAVPRWCLEPGPGILVLPRPSLERLERQSGPLGLRELAAAGGLHIAKGRWVELVALERGRRRREKEAGAGAGTRDGPAR